MVCTTAWGRRDNKGNGMTFFFGARALGMGCAIVLVMAQAAFAQDPQSFRIATGGTAGTYFPIGVLVGSAISAPPGSRACEDGGACGVPGLTATPISTNGSVENVEAIIDGRMESGFAQSDVVTWAATGTGIWEGRPAAEGLRAIANLYPEAIHVVASRASGIKTLADLAGKRVSLDEPGSGTLVGARILLSAVNLTEDDVIASYSKAADAAQQMLLDRLDAFIFVGGYPSRAIDDLSRQMEIDLIPIGEAALDFIMQRYEFFSPDVIPADAYAGHVVDVSTISVNAQWVTSVDQPDALIYAITQALWNDTTANLLRNGHAKGRYVTLETALDGVGIALHPGAEQFYIDAGMLQ